MALKLNQNHWAALVFGIFGWVLGWYSLVLVTASISNPNEQKFPLKPTTTQFYGIGFAVVIAILSWLQRLFAIQGDEEQQD
jgi:amino acid permease